MNTTARVGSFVLGLAVVAGAATGIGAAVGPVEVVPERHGGEHEAPDVGAPTAGEHGGRHDTPTDPVESAGLELPGGLTVSQNGYSLDLLKDSLPGPGETQLQFRVTDLAGSPVTAYEKSHGKDMHLIVVRRDLTDYQHVHPLLDEGGTWSVPVTLSRPGEYRVFADFHVEGAETGYTLGHDLSVAGRYRPATLPAANRTARVDGYDVRLVGDLEPSATSRLTLTVMRDGAPVTDLEPYLGAYGHLVALRDDDLAYLHVHPDGVPGDGRTDSGPEIAFDAEVPSLGDYRLFLDFRHDGRVRTAAFTLSAKASAESTEPTLPADAGEADEPGQEEHNH